MHAFRYFNVTENLQKDSKKKIFPNLEIKKNASKYTWFNGKNTSLKTNKQILKWIKMKAHGKISVIKYD